MTRSRARKPAAKGKGRLSVRPQPLLLPLVQDAWEKRTPKKARARSSGAAGGTGHWQYKLFRLPLRRANAKRPRTIGTKPLTREELRTKALLDQRDEPARLARRKLPVLQMPKTRAGCVDVPRPCPFVRCVHNNYLTITDNGTIKVTYPDLEPWQMDPDYSCSEDVGERGATVEEVAYALNMHQERERQVEVSGKRKYRASKLGQEMAKLYRDD